MAHDINRMIYVGELSWHGLGVRLPARASYGEIVQAAGFYEAVENDVYVPPLRAPIPDKKALVRGDSGEYLAVVGKVYEVVQLFETAIGIERVRGTAWAAFPGRTEYADHHRLVRDTGREDPRRARLASIWKGRAAGLEQAAAAPPPHLRRAHRIGGARAPSRVAVEQVPAEQDPRRRHTGGGGGRAHVGAGEGQGEAVAVGPLACAGGGLVHFPVCTLSHSSG